ncbi:MAG: MASE3 domain-containing protein [Omnitrophica WOR_2 bacterium]
MPDKRVVVSIGKNLLLGSLFLSGLYLASLNSYLLFHSIAEVFTVVIACGIFMLVWNARSFSENNYLSFIGIAYLFVAGLDLLHALTYEGMGVLNTVGANLPTQLWVGSRFLQSLSFLIAPILMSRKLKIESVVSAFALVTGLILSSIFWWHIFPVCYIDGIGLTPFKKESEVVVSILLMGSILLLWWRRQEFDPGTLRLIMLSLGFNIAAEIAFSFYVNVYGVYNLVGHFFRFISYYIIYKAIVETGFVKPYDLLFHNLKSHEKALWQQTVELQMRNEDLDAFAHTVAHDLKNPLAGIITAANALSLPDISPDDRQELLQGIEETAFKMKNIIDNLLLLSEVRKSEVPKKPLDMQALVLRSMDRLASMIREKEAQIQLPGEWPDALGYSDWIEEVWVNYLSNALKYGGSHPQIEFGASPLAGGMVRFWIHDHGPGLSPQEQEHLFKPFTRLSQLNSIGHGLGLSIVRRIIEKLDGRVGVESEAGKGSTFYFTLPAAKTQHSIRPAYVADASEQVYIGQPVLLSKKTRVPMNHHPRTPEK